MKPLINPDIVAVKNNTCVFFEDKDRFYYPDYQKVNLLITENNYTDAISELLKGYDTKRIVYGIGFPTTVYSDKAKEANVLVDFVIGVDEDGTINKLYLKNEEDFFKMA